MNDVQKAIIKTINWFDIFDFPLTAQEVAWYLYKVEDQSPDISGQLQDLVEKGILQFGEDKYYLPGRQDILNTRTIRQIESDKKIRIAKKTTTLIRHLPFVRAVFLCNVLGYYNAKKEDDIDFLIITKGGHIWTTRWFVTGIFKLLGKRASPGKEISDKLCFSFYMSVDGLNLSTISFEDDPYLAWWLTGLVPLHDQGQYLQKIINSNNWTNKYLQNFSSRYDSLHTKDEQSGKQKLLESIFTAFERLLEIIQKKIMPRRLKQLSTQRTGVIISNTLLKFHLVDRRGEFAKIWHDRCRNI